jgi:hypothetical protein
MGSVAAQLFSGLSRDVRSGSSPGSGWATQGHSETCPEATSALSFVCVLRVVVLLESESLPQSEVLSALEQIFINYLSVLYFYFIYLLLNLYLTWQVS